MSDEKERVDAYLATIKRLEPDVAPIDASAYYASAAISLKRIADQIGYFKVLFWAWNVVWMIVYAVHR